MNINFLAIIYVEVYFYYISIFSRVICRPTFLTFLALKFLAKFRGISWETFEWRLTAKSGFWPD